MRRTGIAAASAFEAIGDIGIPCVVPAPQFAISGEQIWFEPHRTGFDTCAAADARKDIRLAPCFKQE